VRNRVATPVRGHAACLPDQRAKRMKTASPITQNPH
jgi:hypothetical protein